MNKPDQAVYVCREKSGAKYLISPVDVIKMSQKRQERMEVMRFCFSSQVDSVLKEEGMNRRNLKSKPINYGNSN